VWWQLGDLQYCSRELNSIELPSIASEKDLLPEESDSVMDISVPSADRSCDAATTQVQHYKDECCCSW